MIVHYKFIGGLEKLLGTDRETLCVENSAASDLTIFQGYAALCNARGICMGARERNLIKFYRMETLADQDSLVAEGDKIIVFLPVSGG